MPYLFRRLSKTRTTLEELQSNPSSSQVSALLIDAYGKLAFRCPVIQCPHFQQGFATELKREEHLKSHDRSYQCTHESCHYSIIGFPSASSLADHLNACHGGFDQPLFDQPSFPRVKKRSLEYALRDAIDKDDALAVRVLARELSAVPDRATDFLLRAVKKRNESLALILINILGSEADIQGVEPGKTDKKKYSVVYEAAKYGHEELMKIILQLPYDIDFNYINGYRSRDVPIYKAVKKGQWQIVRLLVSSKNVMLKKSLYTTILGRVASSGPEEALTEFLELGQKFFDIGPSILNAIRAAQKYDRYDTLKLLFEWGRKLGIEGNYPKSLGFTASKDLQETAADFLQGEMMVHKNGASKGSSLQLAAVKGNFDMVLRLLDAGANVNSWASFGTAVHAAASHGHTKIVEELLKRGALVDPVRLDRRSKNVTQRGSLEAAVVKGHISIVKLLLENGADVNSDTGFGKTVLEKCKNEAMRRLLLEFGAVSWAELQARSSNEASKAEETNRIAIAEQSGQTDKSKLECQPESMIQTTYAGTRELEEGLMGLDEINVSY
jgi:hypothetical protein